MTQLWAILTSSFKHLVLTGSSLGGDNDLGLVHTGMSATPTISESEVSVMLEPFNRHNNLNAMYCEAITSTCIDQSA